MMNAQHRIQAGAIFVGLLFLSTDVALTQTADQVRQVGKFYSERDGFSGEIVVAKSGHVVSEENYGYANVEWKLPITSETRFPIGSVTKEFTAAAILLLQEQGRLKTTDSVARYYSEAPASWKSITLRELLTHTSGIPDDLFVDGFPELERGSHSPEDVVKVVKDLPLKFTPGTTYAYTNIEYVLLGLVIERVSGEPYSTFLRDHFLVPLGMSHSGFAWTPQIIPSRAYGYTPAGGTLIESAPFDVGELAASGGMYSTGQDLALWLDGLHGGRVLKPASLEEMTTPNLDDYAYGLTVSLQYGSKDIGHGGDLPGFHTSTEYFPKTKTAIIVLSNIRAATGLVSPGTYAIVNELMALSNDPLAITPSSGREVRLKDASVKELTGRYRLEIAGAQKELEIVEQDGRLQLSSGTSPGQWFSLRAESPHRFYVLETDAELEFTTNNGAIQALMIFDYKEETGTRWLRVPKA